MPNETRPAEATVRFDPNVRSRHVTYSGRHLGLAQTDSLWTGLSAAAPLHWTSWSLREVTWASQPIWNSLLILAIDAHQPRSTREPLPAVHCPFSQPVQSVPARK